MLNPQCLPILIGSLPLVSHQEAVELILSHTPEIPLWPQLPKLPREGMIRQFITGLPGLIDHGDKWQLSTGSDDFGEEMAHFYEDYLDEGEKERLPEGSRFALGSDSAGGFELFVRTLADRNLQPLVVKGQVTGPMTTGIGVEDEYGKPIFYDDTLRDMVTKLIAMKARWQVEQLRVFAKKTPPIIFIDEPGMVSFGSTAYTTVSKDMVVGCVEEVIGEIKGNHPANWPCDP